MLLKKKLNPCLTLNSHFPQCFIEVNNLLILYFIVNISVLCFVHSYHASILQHQHPSPQLLPQLLLNQLCPSFLHLKWEIAPLQHPGQKNSKPEPTDKPITATLRQTLLPHSLLRPQLWLQSLVLEEEQQHHQSLWHKNWIRTWTRPLPQSMLHQNLLLPLPPAPYLHLP